MPAYTAPVDDTRFILDEVLDYARLFRLPAFAHGDAETGAAVLREAARFAEGVLAPLNATGDEVGSRLEDGRVVTPPGFAEAYRRFTEAGWTGLDMPLDAGGQGMPVTLQVAVAEMFNGACIAFSMLPLMQRAAARLLIAHGAPDLAETCVPRLIAGDWGATICISEAQAGSDVGRIRTTARPADGGTFKVTGTKIFITYGDQDWTDQICHMVLARTPGAAPGTRGLSLFLVPRRRFAPDGELGAENDVFIARVEHKMGLKASPTCVVDFDGAVGYRIGGEGEGLKVMFAMINLMRLEVAVQGVAVAGAATAQALAYAAERPQGGPADAPPVAIIEHADVRRMLMLMRARTQAIRALVLEAAFNLDLAAAGTAEERQAALELAEWLLPVCKAHGAEVGFEVANLAVQVFGGHGYVSDAGVEQYVRDIRVAAIYEGTTGIQAHDLVMRKLAGRGGARYARFRARVEADLARWADHAELAEIHRAVTEGLQTLEACSARLIEQLERTPRDAEAGACAYLTLVGLIAGGWMWLRMAGAAGNRPQAATRQALARFYARYVMAEVPVWARRVELGTAVLDALPADVLAG